MKPVLVLQHLSGDGPAYLGSWLRDEGVPFVVHNAEAGEAFPESIEAWAALAVLGGEMSANDDLPSLRVAERLIRQAVQHGVPVLGHCLGGQLMARALGAKVIDSPAPEVGWQPLEVTAAPEAQAWLGDAGPRTVFQWHFEAFELPPGALRLARSAACPNQAFAIGPHLAMQFHVEIDAEKMSRWAGDDGKRYRRALAAHPGSVQSGDSMRSGLATHIAVHQALARRVYRRWLGAK